MTPARKAGRRHATPWRGRWVPWGSTCLILLATGCTSAAPPRPGLPPPATRTVKVATVHFAPAMGDVQGNRQQLVRLTEEAGRNGAKIVVHTEMATSGYSYFSRAEISQVAERVPGPTTRALGDVARRFGLYVAVGMPVVDTRTHLYYNSAVLLGPDGGVAGIYHKRNNLLEASYNAERFAPLPTFDTPYGRLAIVICSDLFYSQVPRLAALAKTDILLAPANVGVTLDFLRVRAFEDGFAIVVANRYGKERQGAARTVFDQNTFTIPPPFPYDFQLGSRSVIVAPGGEALADLAAPATAIGYGDLPVRGRLPLPVVRRPELYSLIGQDTLEPYTFSQLHLPPAATFAAAAIDPGAAADPWAAALGAARQAFTQATAQGYALRLAVFPGNYFPGESAQGLKDLQALAQTDHVDLVLGFSGDPPTTRLLTSAGETYLYRRTHRGRNEPIAPGGLADAFLVIDRDYARLALLQDRDLFAPETSIVMAKMGVDVVAVGADSPAAVLSALWQTRSGDYLHLVVANRQGKEGVYLGGYRASPSFLESAGLVILQMSTADVRTKKEPRFLDFLPLLLPCGEVNC